MCTMSKVGWYGLNGVGGWYVRRGGAGTYT
jgi:hypothetical protein